MYKVRSILAIMAIFSTQAVFAHDDNACDSIVKACTSAGYVTNDEGTKRFWQDCMGPILLGKAVDGVTVDAANVKDCRKAKIEKMKKELKELEKASKS
jgi:hypothetical protein